MLTKRGKLLIGVVAAVVVAVFLLWWGTDKVSKAEEVAQEEIEAAVELLYGIDHDGLTLEEGVIQSGQTISTIFNRYGISPAVIDRTAKAADSVFSLRNIQAGKNYTVFLSEQDSLRSLVHFVYEHNLTEFLVISLQGDSIEVRREHKDIELERQMKTAEITSSMWNAIAGADMPIALFTEMENIYQWSVDFFGLQKGDKFTVIYDEKFVDSTSVGIGQVWGAVFTHSGKDYYAIPFDQDGKVTYWDEVGNSLRKAMLKAPLKYSRISSRFSPNRMHPVHRVVRPHYGVDYAAPAGTEVYAVADGNVTFRGWDSKGGGNTLKIRHNSQLETGYLHLRGFAPGIVQGKRVSQGDLIGYVGSTGTSTGPHLDYRVWVNGKPVDPLKMTSEPAEPISDKNIGRFMAVRDRVLGELKGELPDSLRITTLEELRKVASDSTSFVPPGAVTSAADTLQATATR